jgi:DNA topoisomerase VI subunit A
LKVDSAQHTDGLKIPRGDLSEFSSDTAKFILLVEKASMFETMSQLKFFTSNAIVVSGGGNPSLLSRYTLLMFSN